MSDNDDRQRGLYRKYELFRVRHSYGREYRERVTDPFFALRYTTDPHAAVALRAYADSCEAEYPVLAAELRSSLGIRRCDCGNENHPSWCEDTCASQVTTPADGGERPTVSDPAVEAAQRAWTTRYGWDLLPLVDEKCDEDEDIAAFVTAAAREMAKPIRDWFHSQQEQWVNGQGGISPMQLAELAPLIFSSEELEQ